MTSWRDTLRSTADLAPDLKDDLERLIVVIDNLISGRTDNQLLDQVLGEKQPPELEAKLDRIGRQRAKSDSSESFAALWGTLRGTSKLLAELSRIRRGGTPRLEGHFSIGEALRQIEEEPPPIHSGEFRCPRCHADHVQFRRESVGEGHQLFEFRCRRCGLYDSVLSDDPGVSEWKSVSRT